jgi:excisionase family DNA binding protein
MGKSPRTTRPILSRSEVATLFGVSASTITRWARDGRLPCIQTLGGHRRYVADDVRRLVERTRRAPDAGPATPDGR